jgi:hypothetical protein
MTQAVQHLLCKHQVLSSNSCSTKKKEKEKKKIWHRHLEECHVTMEAKFGVMYTKDESKHQMTEKDVLAPQRSFPGAFRRSMALLTP